MSSKALQWNLIPPSDPVRLRGARNDACPGQTLCNLNTVRGAEMSNQLSNEPNKSVAELLPPGRLEYPCCDRRSIPEAKAMTLKVYISGKLFDKEDAKISVYDHGLLYGDGVFEGIRS